MSTGRQRLDVEFYNRLLDLFGPRRVSRNEQDLLSYSRDLWPIGMLWIRDGEIPYSPNFIVWPETTEEVSKLLKMCNERGMPLVPFGGGSGMCGGAVPIKGGVICDMKRMNRIEGFSERSLLVTAQSGIIGEHLERELNRKGYSLGHCPSSMYISSLGGWLAARSAGFFATKYGKIEDMVVSIQAVLPDGTVIHTKTTPRSAAGPDFDQILMGSEGTLAIITKTTLRMHVSPESVLFHSFVFKNIADGVAAIRHIMRDGIKPAAVRLYDEQQSRNTLDSIGYAAEGNLLLLVFEGTPRCTIEESQIGLEHCLSCGGQDMGEEPARNWYENRYSENYRQSLILSKDNMVTDTIEVAAIWSNLLPLYQKIKNILEPHVTVNTCLGHAYPEGASLSFSVTGKTQETPDRSLYMNIWSDALAACIEAGGTISHHHGIGLLRAFAIHAELGAAFALFAGMKKFLDPKNILNPGKLGLT